MASETVKLKCKSLVITDKCFLVKCGAKSKRERERVNPPYPALEGERIAGCRVPVAVTLPALAAEQDVADPEGEKLHF